MKSFWDRNRFCGWIFWILFFGMPLFARETSAQPSTPSTPQPPAKPATAFFWRSVIRQTFDFKSECDEVVNGETETRTVISARFQTQAKNTTSEKVKKEKDDTRPTGRNWPVEFRMVDINLSRTENGTNYSIRKRGPHWLWMAGKDVLIDTESGIGIDAVYFIERRTHGEIRCTERGRAFDERSRSPETLGLLGQILFLPLPESGVIAGQTFKSEVHTNLLGNWSLKEPGKITLNVTPASEEIPTVTDTEGQKGDSEPETAIRLAFTFRQTRMPENRRDGLKIDSLVDTNRVIGATLGRGSGYLLVDPKNGRILSAELTAKYLTTVPGDGKNQQMEIRLRQSLKESPIRETSKTAKTEK